MAAAAFIGMLGGGFAVAACVAQSALGFPVNTASLASGFVSLLLGIITRERLRGTSGGVNAEHSQTSRDLEAEADAARRADEADFDRRIAAAECDAIGHVPPSATRDAIFSWGSEDRCSRCGARARLPTS
ncbi:hypothetical protein [Actinomadura sp. 3N508]|uniref:hypothetical protein n=1 Tax=Actinomadura sp. 3N508 TaxID=3375153 RepID=UPI0037A5A2F7